MRGLWLSMLCDGGIHPREMTTIVCEKECFLYTDSIDRINIGLQIIFKELALTIINSNQQFRNNPLTLSNLILV